MLYVGLVFGVVAGDIAAHAAGIDPLRSYIATLILVVPALAGARLLYVAVHWGAYRHNLNRIWDRRQGGYVMYGGLAAVLVSSIPLLRALGLDFGVFWDVSAFTILVGMVFARVGCLLNGCCAGCVSDAWFSANLPNSRGVWAKRVPTQMFEAAAAAGLLAAAVVVWRWMPFPGALFLFVTLGYSCTRFVMEFARERDPGAGVFRVAHVISAIAFLSSASILNRYWHR
jgi:phosphatidylglycerol:prolipoprotein diacylglycerol transferase